MLMKTDAPTAPLGLDERLEKALAENERFKRHLAHYARVIEDCQICCDPPAD